MTKTNCGCIVTTKDVDTVKGVKSVEVIEHCSMHKAARKMFDMLKGATTQVICTRCHTMGTYDGKVCTRCGGTKMIEPVKVLDHKAVEALVNEAEGRS